MLMNSRDKADVSEGTNCVVYCDFDGTLIHGDIELEWLNYLMKRQYLKWYHYMVAAITLPVNALQKIRWRGNRIKSWSIGMTDEKFNALFRSFFQERADRLLPNRKVVALLESMHGKGKNVILTGSDERLIERYLMASGMHRYVDRVIGGRVGPKGFVVSRHPYGRDKCGFIQIGGMTIGIANEYADRFYLELCTEAYVVDNECSHDWNLLELAAKNKWRVI